MKFIVAQLICLSIYLAPLTMAICDRKPLGSLGDRTPANDNFQIYIKGNPSAYIPGNQYIVSIECDSKLSFTTFTLAVESEDPSFRYQLGHFDLIDIAESKFSVDCENMIESANTNTKSRVDVAWIAPTSSNASGCILFRAGVLQNRKVWYIDDGFLTKRFCPEEIDEINSQTPLLDHCCACDEAKYEITLERKWSRNTHPTYFPEDPSVTRFTELIGASHTRDYKFWEYGTKASEGLKALAEHGITNELEVEIKQNLNDGSLRTIIKAPGITYRRNVIGTTLANVRVDPTHHLISLVSKIFPSPDWIIGVSGLELCLENCTWIDEKVLNLYPWDVGTDAGPSYMSPDQPQMPPDVIRRINSSYPNDKRSPFFDETGLQMKPLATLYIKKKKIYERKCEYDNGEDNQNQALECATHPWNEWIECNTKCGPGTQRRFRVFKDPSLAENYRNCDVELEQERDCTGENCGMPDAEEEETNYDTNESAECALSQWSAWSQCSKSCGTGYKTRTRDYLKPNAKDRCQRISFVKLYERENCFINKCGGSLGETYNSEDGDNNESDDQYNTIYRRPQSGRFGNNRNSNRNQAFDGRNDDQYGENRNYQSNYDATLNANENDETPSEYGSNMYNSRNFIGQNQRSDGRNNMNTPDLNNFNQNANRNNFGTRPNSRLPFPTSPTIAPQSPYFGNINPNVGNNPSQFGFNEDHNNPENDNAVAEFCLSKPYALDAECSFREVVTKNFWFYDADDQECKIFTSDNCDKNKNRFNTLEECEEVCLKPHKNQMGIGVDNYDPFGNGYGRGFGESESLISWRNRGNVPRRQSGFNDRNRRF